MCFCSKNGGEGLVWAGSRVTHVLVLLRQVGPAMGSMVTSSVGAIPRSAVPQSSMVTAQVRSWSVGVLFLVEEVVREAE